MKIHQVAIVVHEDRGVIFELAKRMCTWVAGTTKNKATVEALWKLDAEDAYHVTHYDVLNEATAEEKCLIAIDQVEDHHSSVFNAVPWLEIQVHGCRLTPMLQCEFEEYTNITITDQNYGFSVTRHSEN